MTQTDLSKCNVPVIHLLNILCFSPSSSSFLSFPLLLLQSHDCLRSGPPEIGELIVVSTPEGQVLNASFVKQHTHKLYQVREIHSN